MANAAKNGALVCVALAIALLLGEAAWATAKALLSAFCVLVVGALWGGVGSIGGALASLPLLAVASFAFATCGLAATAYAKSWEFFSYFFTFWITPMFVFSGVFFPPQLLPQTMQSISKLLPATYGLTAIRGVLIENNGLTQASGPIIMLLGFLAVLLPLSIGIFSRAVRRAKREGSLIQY